MEQAFDQAIGFLAHHLTQTASLVATLVAGFFTFFAWLMTQRDNARKRDHELFDWGSDVIRTMSEIETCAAEIGAASDDAWRGRLMDLKSRSSALVDQGRLFFPNVRKPLQHRRHDEAAYKGVRLALLDEVVRAFIVAKHLLDHGPPADEVPRLQMRNARRRFVTRLQREMGQSLRKPSANAAGRKVPSDPYAWPL